MRGPAVHKDTPAGPCKLQHWSPSHAFSPSQGHISFESKGYDMLFVRHTLNHLQNSSHKQWSGKATGTPLPSPIENQRAGTNPCDTSVSTAFQHSIVIHYTSLLFRQQFPQRTTDLITLCKAAEMPESHLGSGFSSRLACPGTGLQTLGGESGCPSAPGASMPGLSGSTPGRATHEAPAHPGPREEATLPAGCHSR